MLVIVLVLLHQQLENCCKILHENTQWTWVLVDLGFLVDFQAGRSANKHFYTSDVLFCQNSPVCLKVLPSLIFGMLSPLSFSCLTLSKIGLSYASLTSAQLLFWLSYSVLKPLCAGLMETLRILSRKQVHIYTSMEIFLWRLSLFKNHSNRSVNYGHNFLTL
jgi:hypothetical protein